MPSIACMAQIISRCALRSTAPDASRLHSVYLRPPLHSYRCAFVGCMLHEELDASFIEETAWPASRG